MYRCKHCGYTEGREFGHCPNCDSHEIEEV